eukprot:TRINITY_DN5338_c0_g1_i2.p1 TRINITY_DN5338_c0_g1~~TRINITY_DN5338_c0_g1_i2.p1  ORF type:complete len:1156 (+),score=293.78 TRINITY_DN5338_c0_g1_i2:372-3470(+)
MTPDKLIIKNNNFNNPTFSHEMQNVMYLSSLAVVATQNYWGSSNNFTYINSRFRVFNNAGTSFGASLGQFGLVSFYPAYSQPVAGLTDAQRSAVPLIIPPDYGLYGTIWPKPGMANIIWSPENGTVLISAPVTVPLNVTLVILPGTVVKFAPGVSLIINGTIVARGLSDNPIIFTSASKAPLPGDWGTILVYLPPTDLAATRCYSYSDINGTSYTYQDLLNPSRDNSRPYGCSVFDYCQFMYGANVESRRTSNNNGDDPVGLLTISPPWPGWGAYHCWESTPAPLVTNSIFKYSGLHGYATQAAVGNVIAVGNSFESNKFQGMVVYRSYGSVLVQRNSFSYNLGGALTVLLNADWVYCKPIAILNNVMSYNRKSGEGIFAHQTLNTAGIGVQTSPTTAYRKIMALAVKGNVLIGNVYNANDGAGYVMYFDVRNMFEFSNNYIIGCTGAAGILHFLVRHNDMDYPAAIHHNFIVGSSSNTHNVRMYMDNADYSSRFDFNYFQNNKQMTSSPQTTLWAQGRWRVNNNTFMNLNPYELQNNVNWGEYNFDATSNYWNGLTSNAAVQNIIWDYNDNSAKSIVLLDPILSTPVTPPYFLPSVASVSPQYGPSIGGTVVQIKGVFSNSTQGNDGMRCSFGGIVVPAIYYDSTTMGCVSPSSSAGPVYLEVSMDSFYFTSNYVQFTFIGQASVQYYAPGVVAEFQGYTPTLKISPRDPGNYNLPTPDYAVLNLDSMNEVTANGTVVSSVDFPANGWSRTTDVVQIMDVASHTPKFVELVVYTQVVGSLTVTVSFFFPKQVMSSSYGLDVAAFDLSSAVLFSVTVGGWSFADVANKLAFDYSVITSGSLHWISPSSFSMPYIDTSCSSPSYVGSLMPCTNFTGTYYSANNTQFVMSNSQVNLGIPNVALVGSTPSTYAPVATRSFNRTSSTIFRTSIPRGTYITFTGNFQMNVNTLYCDGILLSGTMRDACGVCGGDNSTCKGCDGVPNSHKVIDGCGLCGGDNTTCNFGCDGVKESGMIYICLLFLPSHCHLSRFIYNI